MPLVLAALCAPVFFYGLGDYSLVNGDEGIYQAIAEHMVESGNWLRLTFKGEHRVYDTFMNAPLQYWARAILIALFGSSLWTVRLLSAVLGVATVWVTWRLALQWGRPRAAFLSAAVQLSTFQFVYLHGARTGEFDTAVTFLLALVALLFLRALQTGGGFWLHHAVLALMVNVKLPFVLIPLLAEGVFLLFSPAHRLRLRSWLVTGLVMGPLSLAWHASQLVVLWEPFWNVMGRMGREATGASKDWGALGLLGNLRFYASVISFGAFPYAFFYPLAVLSRLRAAREAEGWRWLVLLAFPASVLIFYVCVAKHFSWYIMPIYPFLSVCLGVWLDDLIRRRPSAAWLVGLAVALALMPFTVLEVTTYNPFAESARTIPMLVGWRSVAVLSPLLGVTLGACALLLGGWFLRRQLESHWGAVSWGVVLILGCTAGVRVIAPLAFVDHQSHMAEVRSQLDSARARGEKISFPVEIRQKGHWLARYYLVDDFKIAEARDVEGVSYFLLRKGGRKALPGATNLHAPLRSTPPNVLLYVVDTLRADHLGCYGSDSIRTPFIDELAREGTRFATAYAASSWTRASMASLLTSLHAPVHGVEGRDDRLVTGVVMLSEVLKASGYQTASITANPNTGAAFGFDQGYDSFAELYRRREAGYVRQHELIANADEVTERALAWIDQAEEPFFLVTLSIDPHTPYTPPKAWDLYGLDLPTKANGTKHWLGRNNLDEAARARIKALYGGEVSFADAAFGSLLAGLRERSLLDETLVVFTSDHGEEFWEHGERGHGKTLSEEVLRVPLVIRLPESVPVGEVIRRPVQLVDVFPTILELLDIPLPPGLDGTSLLDPTRPQIPAFARLDLDGQRLATLRSGRWKLTLDEGKGVSTFYDLKSKRAAPEPASVHQLFIELGQELSERLNNYEVRRKALEGGEAQVAPEHLDRDSRRALEALGYLESDPHGE